MSSGRLDRLGRSRRRALLIAIGPGLLLAACERPGGAGPSGNAVSFKSVDITGADYARELNLTDSRGTRRSLAEFRGRIVVVFFGFTQCPDVCPTTLVELAEIRKALGPDGERVQGIFVTVDPERDTPEVVQAYVDNFGAGFVALRGTLDETRAVAKHFRVYFNKVPGKTEGSYTLDHTAGSYVFDTQGRIRLFTRHGMGPEALKSDLSRLLAEARV
ncbi:MAG: SCO family protein [Rubrivivax sp.]|jgi:protein SCO1/2